jgi:hypothetical protein
MLLIRSRIRRISLAAMFDVGSRPGHQRLVDHDAFRVRYRLTPHGRTLSPVYETLWSWGTHHLARISRRQDARLKRVMREFVTPTIRDSADTPTATER